MDKTPEWAKQIFKAARQRARVKGLACTITPEYITEMAERSGHRCELTGIPFDFSKFRRTSETRRPFFPSIDRLDNSIGYKPGNVRLVAVAVNYAMNDWGEDVLRLIAKGLLFRLSANDELHARNKGSANMRGVTYRGENRLKPFEARIGANGKCITIGMFETEKEAHFAYLAAKQRKAHGLPVRPDNANIH